MFVQEPMVTGAQLSKLLATESLSLVAELEGASNGAYVASLGDLEVVYKPVSGETPLWDFPMHTLSKREVMASWVDEHFGWNLVPPTVWAKKGPLGPGSVQVFINQAQVKDVDIFPPDEIPADWAAILEGTLDGKPVVVAHTLTDDVMRLAALDVILNNADRKAGHVLRDDEGHLKAIDHGVCFHPQYKLRSVLWGWVGEPLNEHLQTEIRSGLLVLEQNAADWLLSQHEFDVMLQRGRQLVENGFPEPSDQWPAVPWPIF